MASADLAAALANNDLGEFEGAKVLSVGIEIPSVAGGLREALKIDPQVMHRDDEVMVLLRCKVGKLRFDPVKDTQGVQRVHVLNTTEATIVDGDVFDQALVAQREAIDLAKRQASGEANMDDALALEAEHDDGFHGDLVPGCPSCDAEVEAQEAEQAEADNA